MYEYSPRFDKKFIKLIKKKLKKPHFEKGKEMHVCRICGLLSSNIMNTHDFGYDYSYKFNPNCLLKYFFENERNRIFDNKIYDDMKEIFDIFFLYY